MGLESFKTAADATSNAKNLNNNEIVGERALGPWLASNAGILADVDPELFEKLTF